MIEHSARYFRRMQAAVTGPRVVSAFGIVKTFDGFSAGIPLGEVEDLLLESAAYRQAARVLLPKLGQVRGRPLTPLHGGHVGLLCTAGMLNGVFGEGDDRHIAHWRSVKFTDHWEEEEEDGTKTLHDRDRFSHELTLILCHRKDADSDSRKDKQPVRSSTAKVAALSGLTIVHGASR
jgi:hypothetical protein